MQYDLLQPNWDERQLVAILQRICLILQIAFTILLSFYVLIWNDPNAFVGVYISVVCTGIAFWLTLRGKSREASLFLALTLVLIVTGLATLGQGIHDVVIVAYPAILIVFSLLLSRRAQFLLVFLIIVSVMWLTFGAIFGVFVPKQAGVGNLANFIVVVIVLLVTSASVQLLTANLRQNLLRAQQEIAERIQTEAALQASEERYALAARGANDGLWDWDLVQGTIFFSPRWKAMLGYTDDAIGMSPNEWLDRLHPDDRARLEMRLAGHTQRLLDRFEIEYRIAHQNGGYRWMVCRGLAVWNPDHQATRIVGSQTDITERKAAEERLRHDALHDTLTDLPNRSLFLDRLLHAIQRMQRIEQYAFAVLLIDLDRFKTINDSLSHLIGDRLLIAVARALEGMLRAGDTVARLGGDEFTILLENISTPNDAVVIAERVLKTLSDPFLLGEHEVFTSASIGIALSNKAYQRGEEVLRDADTAMYEAKMRGKSCYVLFDHTMHARALEALQLDTDLRRMVERQEMRLYYQPIVLLATGKVIGFEALLRWQHPERGLLAPGTFLHLAEELGFTNVIGQWTLNEACRQLAVWQAEIPHLPPLTMSVNLAPQQLTQPDLATQIARVLEKTGLAPQQLMLEIVESALLNIADAEEMINQLHALDVILSVDDFGTGYSALSYLHQLPIRKIKIDRSFVSRIETDHQHRAIITAIIAMAHALGMQVVAEGIETEMQYELLKQFGCTHGQGWLFARPLDSTAATELLQGMLPHA